AGKQRHCAHFAQIHTHVVRATGAVYHRFFFYFFLYFRLTGATGAKKIKHRVFKGKFHARIARTTGLLACLGFSTLWFLFLLLHRRFSFTHGLVLPWSSVNLGAPITGVSISS